MWLLVLSDWRFYARSRPRNTITGAPRRQFSQEAVLPRRPAAECALADAITINVHATSWIDCPEDRP
jgi:transposase